jgi:hypothetical protein
MFFSFHFINQTHTLLIIHFYSSISFFKSIGLHICCPVFVLHSHSHFHSHLVIPPSQVPTSAQFLSCFTRCISSHRTPSHPSHISVGYLSSSFVPLSRSSLFFHLHYPIQRHFTFYLILSGKKTTECIYHMTYQNTTFFHESSPTSTAGERFYGRLMFFSSRTSCRFRSQSYLCSSFFCVPRIHVAFFRFIACVIFFFIRPSIRLFRAEDSFQSSNCLDVWNLGNIAGIQGLFVVYKGMSLY